MTTEILGASVPSSPSIPMNTKKSEPIIEVVQNLESTQAKIQKNAEVTIEKTRKDVEIAINELQELSKSFNRRLKFQIDENVDSIIVKVIDPETEKVIKEYPSKELQMVHKRIKEAIGLLFDVLA